MELIYNLVLKNTEPDKYTGYPEINRTKQNGRNNIKAAIIFDQLVEKATMLLTFGFTRYADF